LYEELSFIFHLLAFRKMCENGEPADVFLWQPEQELVHYSCWDIFVSLEEVMQ